MLKIGHKLGKYKIEQRLADGGFAAVFRALDTIEGIRVALKVPHAKVLDESVLRDFRKEVRLTARLEHPNILSIKDASFIDQQFVIAFPLGEKTLGDRLRSRISFKTSMSFADQMLDAAAYAHRQRIIHCDIKPENMILFAENRLRLTDFGIAKVALRTLRASGSGTVGYMAPEQAMGKPSLRSDVFSLGLVLYRLFSGHLPEWPFDWPMPGHQRLRRKTHPDLIEILRRALEVNSRKRFRDADQMLTAFRRIKTRTLRFAAESNKPTSSSVRSTRKRA